MLKIFKEKPDRNKNSSIQDQPKELIKKLTNCIYQQSKPNSEHFKLDILLFFLHSSWSIDLTNMTQMTNYQNLKLTIFLFLSQLSDHPIGSIFYHAFESIWPLSCHGFSKFLQAFSVIFYIHKTVIQCSNKIREEAIAVNFNFFYHAILNIIGYFN